MPVNAMACGKSSEKIMQKEMSVAKSCKESCCGSNDSTDKGAKANVVIQNADVLQRARFLQ